MSTLPPENHTKDSCEKELKQIKKQLFDLQNQLYAKSEKALLVVLQGTDTAGKDGVIRHVFSCMNPMGVVVKSFKKPTELELQHDFLWRVYPHLPPKGKIGVFNRSYFEDLLVPIQHNLLSEDRLEHRVKMINMLENHLEWNDTKVLKFYLSISREEQHSRIEERKQDPAKQWKLTPEDLEIGKHWDKQQEAYQCVFNHCSERPWIQVPSDKKWYRNYFVAKTLRDTLQELL